MAELQSRWTGEPPGFLQHNSEVLADPLSDVSKAMKAITSKRKKVDDDHEELARLEFEGSLYLNGGGEPVIPARMVYACIAGKGGAARLERMGPAAKAGLFVTEDFPLEYDGPKTLDGLWKDKRFRHRTTVVVSGRTIRTRPLFEEWSVIVKYRYDPELVDLDTLIRWVQIAGDRVGIGDWRPQYGRFTVEVLS